MPRLSHTQYFLSLLPGIAARGTCPRRQVGAIITDIDHRCLSMGYNGVPRGVQHCVDTPCPGAGDEKGNTSRCQAVHAEINAILQCADINRAAILYASCTPCFECAKVIANTPIKRILVLEEYADVRGEQILASVGIQVFKCRV